MLSKSNAWDWSGLLYIATVFLNMPEEKFWRTVPRKLWKLMEEHRRFSKSEGATDSNPTTGYIDDIM